MKPAIEPRSASELRVLVVDDASGTTTIVPAAALASLFAPGDLLVVNDAATLPASLHGRTARGEPVELRLVGMVEDRRWVAALFGAGDWHTPTELRSPPPLVSAGDRLVLGEGGLTARVLGPHPQSARLIELALEGREDASLDAIWAALYRAGRPVQYTYMSSPLALWDVQNVYSARPWAVEMPSAGRGLTIAALLELRRRGVEIARVTHAAGLSSIGDAASDAILPLPERYEVEEATWEAIARTRKRGGRVIAIGTSTVRALEGAARDGKRTGVTSLRLGPGVRRAIVDAVLTGGHEAGTSHHELLRAFAKPVVLERALACAEERGLLGHEMGDAWLVWGEPRENLRTPPRAARRDEGAAAR